jgi:hypothetical protein
MSSERQAEANRRNGARSKGPVSPEGKKTSSRNATTHGLLSETVLLPGEDTEAYIRMADGILADLKPVGQFEKILVHRIISLCWRLKRSPLLEAAILRMPNYSAQEERSKERLLKAIHRLGLEEDRREAGADDQNSQADLNHSGREAELHPAVAQAGDAFLRDCGRENALSKLSRYETSLERSLMRTLHELQRLQAARQGKDVGPPVAIDIDVAGPDQG